MKVFLAGASGTLGRSLVPRLVAAGHEVTWMTRSAERAEAIRGAGASAVVCDALDAAAVSAAIADASPEVVIAQLTALPEEYDPRTIDYGPTNRLRIEGGRNLISAARAAGTRRYITQSIAFLYASEGAWVKDEGARPFTEAPEPFGTGVQATLRSEQEAIEAEGLEGLVLRYGQFYGPGTYYGEDGNIAERVRKRRFPIVGRGSAVSSFIHIDDAADATVAGVERGAPGIYNVVDDDPAPMRDWLPVYARALGAKRPLRVPKWLARMVAGSFTTVLATELRGASNEKAKRELDWTPAHPSWRDGFRELSR